MPNIPLYTVHGQRAHSDLVLTRLSGDSIRINISHEFAGRDVEEELDPAVLQMLGGDEPYRCYDLLGLSFETDGSEIMGSIGAGSANYGFILRKEDWNLALDELASESRS